MEWKSDYLETPEKQTVMVNLWIVDHEVVGSISGAANSFFIIQTNFVNKSIKCRNNQLQQHCLE